ncbi:hypothetical protein D3C76_1776470 [compost metagenome]
MTSHNFYNGGTLMGGHRVTQLVNSIYNDTNRCIKSDGVVRIGNIIINSSRQSHRLNTQFT